MKPKKVLSSVCLMLALGQLALFAQSSPPPSLQAEGTDFILLIDQSGSMGGSGIHPGRNDPTNKRNNLLNLILPELFQAGDKGNISRVSLIEFGSRYGSEEKWLAKITLSCYKIPDKNPGESGRIYRNRVYAELEPFSREQNRGNSDHGQALNLALAEIGKMDQTLCPVPVGRKGVKRRVKVILMITDGQPYIDKKHASGNNPLQLKKEIQDIAARLPKDQSLLYVFGLNAADDYWYGGGYGAFWNRVAESTAVPGKGAGYALFVSNHDRIIEKILPVLLPFTGVYPFKKIKVIDGDTYDCPPYIKSIELIIEFSRNYMDLGRSVEIDPPTGQPIPNNKATMDKNQAVLRFDYPPAGLWRFKRKDTIRIMVKEELEEAEPVVPRSPVPVNTSHKITFKLRGPGKNYAFVPIKNVPVDGILHVTAPDGSGDIINTAPAPGDPGTFHSIRPYLFSQKGIYKLQFSGSVFTGSGEKAVVFHSGDRDLTVKNLKAVDIRLEYPDDGFTTAFGEIQSPLRFTFYHNAVPVVVADVLRPGKSIEAVVVFSPSSVEKTVTLTVAPTSDALIGNLDADVPGANPYTLLFEDIDGRVDLKIDHTFCTDDYYIPPPAGSSGIYEFPVPVRLSAWGVTVIFISVIICCAVVWLFVYILLVRARQAEMSQDIPQLIYRDGRRINPDRGVLQTIDIYKKKLRIRSGEIPFAIVGAAETWKPELKIVKHSVPKGVRITLRYEKIESEAGGKAKDRFEETVLETRDNFDTDKHDIRGLEEYNMIFELKIKED